MWVFYSPVNFYFIWLAIKARSFFFFTASNPTIDFGGMLGGKKSEIFDLIPQEYYPKTILLNACSDQDLLKTGSAMGYPLIAKPDIGDSPGAVDGGDRVRGGHGHHRRRGAQRDLVSARRNTEFDTGGPCRRLDGSRTNRGHGNERRGDFGFSFRGQLLHSQRLALSAGHEP